MQFLYHSKASEKLLSMWQWDPKIFPNHLTARDFLPNDRTEFWLSKLRTLSAESPVGIFQNQVGNATVNSSNYHSLILLDDHSSHHQIHWKIIRRIESLYFSCRKYNRKNRRRKRIKT